MGRALFFFNPIPARKRPNSAFLLRNGPVPRRLRGRSAVRLDAILLGSKKLAAEGKAGQGSGRPPDAAAARFARQFVSNSMEHDEGLFLMAVAGRGDVASGGPHGFRSKNGARRRGRPASREIGAGASLSGGMRSVRELAAAQTKIFPQPG